MANEENLLHGNKDTQFRSGREAVENGQKGGVASGKSRREKKTFRKLTELALSSAVQDKDLIEFAQRFGIDEPDTKMLTVLGMVAASIKGNHNAFDRLLELSGENNESSATEEQKQENLLNAIKKAVKGGN